MKSENEVPIEDRFLMISGKVSNKILKEINIPKEKEGYEFYFVLFSYADLPKGKKFTHLFKEGNPLEYELIELSIDYITQQFGKEFDEIPYGWKVICNFKFKSEKSKLLNSLPYINDWYSSKDYICITNEETYKTKC